MLRGPNGTFHEIAKEADTLPAEQGGSIHLKADTADSRCLKTQTRAKRLSIFDHRRIPNGSFSTRGKFTSCGTKSVFAGLVTVRVSHRAYQIEICFV
jgi:hypothetical protein